MTDMIMNSSKSDKKITALRAIFKANSCLHELHWRQYMRFNENNSKTSNQFNGPNHCAAHYPDWRSTREFHVSYF